MQHFIVNLTQHVGTVEQGVLTLPESDNKQLKELLTFDSIPTKAEIEKRALSIAYLSSDFLLEETQELEDEEYSLSAMIGGAPYLMGPLEAALKKVGVAPLYAFTERKSVEKVVDGKVVKTAVFEHLGFVEA